MDLQMRKALKEAMWKRYRKAPKKMKTQILDELCTITGYHHQYAIAQLKQMKDAEPPQGLRSEERIGDRRVPDRTRPRQSHRLYPVHRIPLHPGLEHRRKGRRHPDEVRHDGELVPEKIGCVAAASSITYPSPRIWDVIRAIDS